MNTLNRIAIVAAAALLAAACGQPTLIDRTQPNYIKKAELLDGTWYWKETVVDTPKTPNTATFPGVGGRLEKIRWEIQEDLLVGYRSYEVVPGADPRVDRENSSIGHTVFQDGRPYRGNPVVAYSISSHFDRQRMYNASTGEQSNVLVEDQQDRPWYEREYMRVNWHKNVIDNIRNCTGNTSACIDGNAKPFRYVTDQDQAPNDDTMVFQWDDEQKQTGLKYFDFTIQAIVDPYMYDYPGYGLIPICMLGYPQYDCESASVKIRTSIRKVDEAHVADYEPLVYGDKLMTKFGFFRNVLKSYDKDYYYTYSGLQYFAMRHDIWKQSKTKYIDANDGKEKYKLIPVAQRPLKPIVYYMTSNTPRYLYSAAMQRYAAETGRDPQDTIEASWDLAFRRAVAVPRGLEPSQVPQMFYVCESPVPEGAPEACGPAGTYARMGDIRYNLIPYVDANVGGLLGMGPSAMDPETGEVVSAVANMYGITLDTWAASSQQVIDVLNGETSLDDLMTGEDIRKYVFDHLNPTDPRRPDMGAWSGSQPLTGDSTRPMSAMARLDGKLATLVETWKQYGTLPLQKQDRKAVVENLIKANPALEDELVNLPEVRVAVQSLTSNRGFQARLLGDQGFYHQVARSLLLGNEPMTEFREKLKRESSPEVGCYYEWNYEDEDYVSTAKSKLKLYQDLLARYQAAGQDPETAKRHAKDDVYDELRREAYRSVTEHELGHTLGLMHNFIGSADAMNYQDGYWQLRKETIGVEVGGRRVLPITPQNLADAAKPNQHQLDQGLYEYTYSSIMDYGARVIAQNKGIGKYDRAAILFGYAGGTEPGWVEVFNELRNNYQQPNITVPVDNAAKVFTVRGAQVEIPLAHAEHYTPVSNFYTDKYHYSTLPFHFADSNPSFDAMLDQGIARMNNRSFRKWSEMEAHYDRLQSALKEFNLSEGGLLESDYVRARDIVNAAGGRAIPVEVPYMFCSDYEVGANLLCNRNDQGADVFEMTNKWLERFNESYVFTNFRRDKLFYSPASVASGKFGRYLGNIPNVYQQWLFNIYYLAYYYSLSAEELDRYYGLGDPIYQNYWTMAVVDSTNTLMQQLAVPSAGYYGKRPSDGAWEYVPNGDPMNRRLSTSGETTLKTELAKPANGGYTDLLYMPRGAARAMFTVYDDDGYDGFIRVNEAGHFWDVYAAMLALTTSETNFLGVDRGSDALRYSLPYYTTFNRELAPLFSAYWTENREAIAGLVGKAGDGTGVVRMPTFLKAQDYVYGFEYPLAPPTPVDGNGSPMVMSKILPTPTWSSRFYSEVWAMAYFTENFNQEYASFNQVYRLGSGEAISPEAGFSVVTFNDPFGGGYVYAALKRTGDTNPPAAPAMVERAATYKTKWDQAVGTNGPIDGLSAAQWEQKVREATRTLEMMRGLYGIFGRAW